MKPYTSETGPPLRRPAAMVLQNASQVAINETQVASMEAQLKFLDN